MGFLLLDGRRLFLGGLLFGGRETHVRFLLQSLGEIGCRLISMVSTLGFLKLWRFLLVLSLRLPLLGGKLQFCPGKGGYVRTSALDLVNGLGLFSSPRGLI